MSKSFEDLLNSYSDVDALMDAITEDKTLLSFESENNMVVYIDGVEYKDVKKLEVKCILELIISNLYEEHDGCLNIFVKTLKESIEINEKRLNDTSGEKYVYVKILYTSFYNINIDSPYNNILKCIDKNILDTLLSSYSENSDIMFEEKISFTYLDVKSKYDTLDLSDGKKESILKPIKNFTRYELYN